MQYLLNMFKKTLLKCAILFFISAGMYAQKTMDTLVASRYYKKGEASRISGNFKESILLYKKALPIYTKTELWTHVMRCYIGMSESQWRIYDKKSIESAKKALEISEKHLSKNNIHKANAYACMGSYYETTSNFNEALIYNLKALELRQKLLPKNHGSILASYNNLAGNYYYLGNYETTLMYLEKTLNIIIETKGKDHPFLGGIYQNMGLLNNRLQKLPEALKFFNKGLDILLRLPKKNKKKYSDIASIYINIGQIYQAFSEFDIALKHYKEALMYCKKSDYHKGNISVLENIGNIASSKGKYDEALTYHKKALDRLLNLHGKEHLDTAKGYSIIGNDFYKKGDYKKALEFYNKTLAIYNIKLKEDHDFIATSYIDIGNIHLKNKEFETALEYYNKALKISIKVFGEGQLEESKLYEKIGNLFLETQTYDEALEYYQKGLQIIKNKYNTNHIFTANFYFNIGTIHYKNKDYNLALEHFDKALASNSRKGDFILNNPIHPNEYFDKQLLLKTLNAKAETLQSQYVLNNSIAYLNQSINLYGDTDKIINHLRQSYQNHQDKIALAKQTKDIYNSAIAAQLLRYKDTKNENDLTQAWYYSEKSKSNILKELLEDTNAKKFAGLPDEVLTLEKNIKSNQAYYQSQIVSLQSKDSVNIEKVKNFENELFSISQKKDSLLKTLKENHPKYYQLKHKKSLITVKDIQNKINEKTTLLEFFTKDSITYAFTISKHSVSVKELKTLQLAQKVKNLNETIISEDTKAYKKLAYNLYKELIAPIKNQCIGDELVIIPDGPLWHLNFELLLTQENEKLDSRNLSYLLRTYAISYANSANLLFNKTINNDYLNTEIRKECLAFSFSDATNVSNSKTIRLETLRNTKEDLPGARKEIKAISKIIDGQYYYGLEAEEANFKQNANQYSMLHLALHGEVDDIKPQNSKLYFTKGKDTIEDNMLYNHELFALNIPADLVVLSACNTGSGKIANGEGLMSLGNAFQYAGVKSLLLSKWEVSDRTTPDLMQYFYANIKNGMNKSKALQQAKLKYLNTSETFYTNPFYWGSFYIIGDTNAIPFENHKLTLYYWIIGGMLCLIGIYFLVKKKRYKNTQTT